MARAFSIKDAAEQLDKLPAMLTHEGATPVVAVTRRGMPVLAVLPWDLYVGLLQTLADLSGDVVGTQMEGLRALLADATTPLTPQAPAAVPRNRQPHRRRPGR